MKRRVVLAACPACQAILLRHLDAVPGINVVGATSRTREFLTLANRHHPEILVIELSLSILAGRAYRLSPRQPCPATFLVLRLIPERPGVSTPLRLVRCTNQLDEPALAEFRLAFGPPPAAIGLESLSPRQREVLQFLAEGLNTKEIGELLGISPKTVEIHRLRVKERLGLRNTVDMVRYALQSGLVRP